MRKFKAIDALLPGTRQGILSATLMHPDKWWYQSDLAKHLGVPSSSLQRELASLTKAGILRQRRDGNRVYFQPDPGCPFLAELTGLIAKTVGIVDVLRETLEPFSPEVVIAFVYGSVARGDERSESDLDLMVIGRLGLSDLAPALTKAEERLGRTANPTVYAGNELAKKFKAGHHFLETVVKGPKLFIVGSQDGLEAITGKRPRTAPRHKQKRA